MRACIAGSAPVIEAPRLMSAREKRSRFGTAGTAALTTVATAALAEATAAAAATGGAATAAPPSV